MHHSQRIFVLDKPKPVWQSHGGGILMLLFLCGACIHTYRSVAGEPKVAPTYKPLQPQFLGKRSLEVQVLEQLLMDKDNEVRFLQYQISKATLNTKLKDSTMEAADNMIKSLQEREERERTARSKAQFILADKVTELNTCNRQRAQLEAQLAQCGEQLDSMTAQLRPDLQIGPRRVYNGVGTGEQQIGGGGGEVESPSERRQTLPEHTKGRRVAH